ncbi:MAG TPA: dephospho-CoA kinase [Acidimicrobiales bacterium]|nr:dephospho-CoA kinase [Acidimicrobiales bacterium]
MARLVVGVTGGIGSGKSTVSALLGERGAVVVDADQLARQVVEPGGPAYQAVVDRFGPGVVAPDGTLDRARLGEVVFSDPRARTALEAVTHPPIRRAMVERVAQAGPDDVVVLVVPLLAEAGTEGLPLDAVVVVDCPVEKAVARLVARRDMAEDDVRSRVAAQATRDERLRIADFVVDNSGDLEQLAAEVDRCWAWLDDLARRGAR